MLEKLKEVYAESNLETPDSNLDRSHRIDKPYFDKIKKIKYKSIIGRFNTFRYRALLYRINKDMKLDTKRLQKGAKRVKNQIRFNEKMLFNLLCSNPTKCSKTLKQFGGKSRGIV